MGTPSSAATRATSPCHFVVKFAGVDSGGFTLDAAARLGQPDDQRASSSQTIDLLGTVGGNLTYLANSQPAFEDIDFANSAVVGGSMKVALGGGLNTLRLQGGLIHGNLSVTGGGGDDTIEMTAAGDLTVDGSVNINLGSGVNTVIGMGPTPQQINVGSNFIYTGGTGNDTFDLDGSGTALHVKGDAKFTLGTKKAFDSNIVNLEALTAGRSVSPQQRHRERLRRSFRSGLPRTNADDRARDGSKHVRLQPDGHGHHQIGGSFLYNGGTGGDVVNLTTTIGKNLAIKPGQSGGAGQWFRRSEAPSESPYSATPRSRWLGCEGGCCVECTWVGRWW